MEAVKVVEQYNDDVAFQVFLVTLGSLDGQGGEEKACSCPYRVYYLVCAGPCPELL